MKRLKIVIVCDFLEERWPSMDWVAEMLLEAQSNLRSTHHEAPWAAIPRGTGSPDSVIVMPYLERRELAALYRRAAMLLMPPDAEGFGLPMVEAMACGTPVIATSLPALREVGGAAVEYCESGDVSGWSKAVMALAVESQPRPQDWRAQCIRRLHFIERFSPKQYAARNLSICRELADSHTGAV
jgi:glycosyltransferase involved in cell wall biosynthesis